MLQLDVAAVPGTATRLLFSLRNTGREAVRFLYWETVFDPMCPKGLEIAADALPAVRYRGASAKHAFDPRVSLVAVEPGEAYRLVVEVSDNYRLPASGPYAVRMARRLLGIVGDLPATPTLADLVPLAVRQDADAGFWLDAVDADLQFPPAVAGAAAGVPGCQVPLCYKSYHEPPVHCVLGRATYAQARVSGGTDGQQSVARAAVDRIFSRLAPRGPYKFEIRDDAVYRKWFGPFTQPRADLVRRAVAGIRGQAVCKTFVIYILAQCERPDTIALFRKPDSDDHYGLLGLCRPFFTLGETGLDSRSGTLGHELSHGYADTDDHAYGPAACLALAKSQPDRAVRNADSVQYFLEDVILSQ